MDGALTASRDGKKAAGEDKEASGAGGSGTGLGTGSGTGSGSLVDENLPFVVSEVDPRILNPKQAGKAQKKKGAGRNTESFDPKSTLVRPSMRVLVGPSNVEVYPRTLKHDDVVIVPEFFCKEDDWSLYYKLIAEMKACQEGKEVKNSEWISWHEGAHLISKNPSGSAAFQLIQDKISAYFKIPQKSVGTRFNFYTGSQDWKPFHHDSAAFNPDRAKNQNITVGVSFGSTRELAFLSAKTGERIYFPQTNGMLFSFGRDVNISYKHGINALPQEEHDGRGRISIILWGMAPDVKEEKDSPPMLTDNTRGNGYAMHASAPGASAPGAGNDESKRRRNDNRPRDRDNQPRDRYDDRRYDDRRYDDRRPDDRHYDDSRHDDRRPHDRERERDWDADRRDKRDEVRGRDDRDRSRDRVRDRSRSRERITVEVCYDFKIGKCAYGSRCKYKH